MFVHEKLDVYQLELKFLGWATEFLVELMDVPSRVNKRELSDQLDRASLSGLLNTAEGNGRRSFNLAWQIAAPKGHNRTAQGFNPGYNVLRRCGLKGHQSWCRSSSSRMLDAAGAQSYATFRAHPMATRYPGLKPWAVLLRPFGAIEYEDDKGGRP